MTDPTDTETATDPSTGPDPTTGPDPDSGSESGTDSGTGGGMVCEPEGDDTTCVTCTKENCCPELEACAADTACACTLECLSTEKNPEAAIAMCAMECDTDVISVSGLLLPIQMCRGANCMEDCG